MGTSQDWMSAFVRVLAFFLIDGVPGVYYMIKITMTFLVKVIQGPKKGTRHDLDYHLPTILCSLRNYLKTKIKATPAQCWLIVCLLPPLWASLVPGQGCIHPRARHTCQRGPLYLYPPRSHTFYLTLSFSVAHTLSDMPWTILVSVSIVFLPSGEWKAHEGCLACLAHGCLSPATSTVLGT